ncbi:hypothetical protein ASZ78_008501 [Callipepla squamata]|uniref:GPALPP motifs-containing protein 1 n=1 Tax=Callipepla squamata TaxID=9009 RepID=A0A226MIY4_CALSU|nr:hypothetical protein ASZ78_008501 [Callipepla squamata]
MFYFWKATDSSEEEDNIIGPMPAKGPVESDVTQEFERRAQRMKEKLTSADSEREEAKKSTSKDNEEIVLSGRDKRLVEQVTSYNESKRSESLMDIHQKKLKSKASEEKNKVQERRPFDREQDLKVNRFDEAQKKALIRKSRDLNSKFEHSKGNMFL